MEGFNERLRHLIDKAGATPYEVSMRTGISQSTLSRLLNKTTSKPNIKNAELLANHFHVNKVWLLTGEGEMLNEKKEGDALSRIGANWDKGDKEGFVSEVTEIPFSDFREVEFVDLHASAGPLGMNNIDFLPDTKRRLIPKEYENGNYLVVRVDGDSMNDGTPRSLYDGDEVLIREKTYERWHEMPIRKTLFVICSRDGNVLKQIGEINTKEGYIVCHSFNPSYRDYRIAFDDILQVFVVLHVVYRKISVD